MNIAVDYGNTTAKVGIFENGRLERKHIFEQPDQLKSLLESTRHESIIVSSVSHPAEEVLSWSDAKKKLRLSAALPLPVKIIYQTPQSLGVDRIAAVCGAAQMFPGQNCLVIDAGTCITYEFLDAQGNYHGGGISPGINMRFEAMNRFTSRLPLVIPVEGPPLVGTSTEGSLQSGVMNGVLAELEGIIARYEKLYPSLRCILCGGDSPLLEKALSSRLMVSPDLVLTGLNWILSFTN